MAEPDAPPAPRPNSFRKHEHLRRPAEFKHVYDRRRSVSDDRLIVYGRETDRPYLRLGMSVGKKYGPAVRRNRLRRLYREAFRLSKLHLPAGLDLILIPRGKDEPTLSHLLEAVPRLVGQLARRLQREAGPRP